MNWAFQDNEQKRYNYFGQKGCKIEDKSEDVFSVFCIFVEEDLFISSFHYYRPTSLLLLQINVLKSPSFHRQQW